MISHARSTAVRILALRRSTASSTPRKVSILDTVLGARLSRDEVHARCRAAHPQLTLGTLSAIEALTGAWSAEVDAFLTVLRSQPPPVAESHPALAQTFNSPIPPSRFRSTHDAELATQSPINAQPEIALAASSPLTPDEFADIIAPVAEAFVAGSRGAAASPALPSSAVASACAPPRAAPAWLASTAAMFGLHGAHAAAMTAALLTNITHFAHRTWPLLLPQMPTPCEPSAFTQISLTAHEYLHDALPRWRTVWRTIIAGYWPAPGASSAPDRREDFALALVALLLQRACPSGADLAFPSAALPAAASDASAGAGAGASCRRSLGGTFSQSRGPLGSGDDSSSEALARVRRVLDVWVRAGVLRVTPDGAGWACASPASEEALMREVEARFDEILAWMVSPARSPLWLDSALQLALMLTRFHAPTHEAPFPSTHVGNAFAKDATRQVSASGHADHLVPVGGSTTINSEAAGDAAWEPRRVTARLVDGSAGTVRATSAVNACEYELVWRRVQRLSWPHLLQMFARHQPLTLEREVLYVMPPRFPYPVFVLLTAGDELVLLSASMLDYASAEAGVEFAYRLHRPLEYLARFVPPHMGGTLTDDVCTLSMYGHSPHARGLPTFGDLCKHVSSTHLQSARSIRNRTVIGLRALHITPAATVTNLDCDLSSVHTIGSRAGELEALIGARRAALLRAAYARWAAAVRPPPEVVVTPTHSMRMLRTDGVAL